MLQDVQGKPEQHVLEQLGIRTMAKAIYTTENIGHYGLGIFELLSFYFTDPPLSGCAGAPHSAGSAG